MTYIKQYLVTEFGARGDARVINDANITTGTNILTSASGASFTASDVGKNITVQYGTSSSAALVTTISGFTNSTTVTLSANAANTVVNGYATFGTSNNSAFTAAQNAAGTNQVIIPPGTYMLVGTYSFGLVDGASIFLSKGAKVLCDASNNTPLGVTANNVTIAGEGIFDGNGPAMSNPASGNAVMRPTGATTRTGLKFYDFTIQNAHSYGLGINNTSKLEVRRVKILNCTDIGINGQIGQPNINDILIDGCYVDMSAAGISPGGSTILGGCISYGGSGANIPSRVRITNNTCIAPPGTTVSLNGSSGCIGGTCNDQVIANNTCYGSNIAISPNAGNKVTVVGNTVYGPKLYGIEMPACTNCTISGNTVDGAAVTPGGIIIDGSASHNNTISGNSIYNLLNSGSSTSAISIASSTGKTLISANYCEVPINYAIVVNGPSNVTITGNNIVNVGTGTDGIYMIGGSRQTITGNQITGGFSAGAITLTASGSPTLTGLVVTGNYGDSTLMIRYAGFTFGAGCVIANNSGALRSVTAATTITVSDDTIVFNSASNITTQALPGATAYPAGKMLQLTNINTGVVTLTTTISGIGSRTLSQWASLTVYTPDNSTWIIA